MVFVTAGGAIDEVGDVYERLFAHRLSSAILKADELVRQEMERAHQQRRGAGRREY